MAQPNAIEPLVNQIVSKVKWIGGHVVDLLAFALLLAAMAPQSASTFPA